MSRPLVLAVAVVVAALTFAVSGCGGDDESEASGVDAWADSFCTAVGDWRSTLDGLFNEFQADPSQFANEDALKDAVQTVSDATDTLVSDLKDLGAPETESGEAVQSSVDSLESTLETQKADVDEAVQNVSSITDVPAAISAIGTAFTTMATSLQSTIETVQNADSQGELEDAFEQSDSCSDLESSTSG
jgi:hypothetical protein